MTLPLRFSFSRSISTIHGGVSRRHSRILKTEEEFLLNPYPFFQRCVVQAWCHPLIIVFDCENSFHPSGAIQESFQFDSPEPIISELFIPAFSSRSPNLTGASFKYSLISSWSLRSHVSKSPQVSSFVFQFFPVNCAFATFIFNSYGGSFKSSLPWLSYQFIRSFQSYRRIVEDFSQVCAISLLILSTRISSMPNPLLVINLNWWRISIM